MDRAHQHLLDRNYRYQRHIYDLTREYYLLGRNRLIDDLLPPEQGTVLEVGCGTARNLIKLAGRHPRVSLFGIDLSRAMLDTATAALARRGLRGRVLVAHADATTFEPTALFGYRSFDRIMFSYTLSMIPAWETALAHAVSKLDRNGSLHIVDFGNGRDLPVHARNVLRAWLRHFHVTPRDGLASHLARLASEANAELQISPLYKSYAIHAVIRRR